MVCTRKCDADPNASLETLRALEFSRLDHVRALNGWENTPIERVFWLLNLGSLGLSALKWNNLENCRALQLSKDIYMANTHIYGSPL